MAAAGPQEFADQPDPRKLLESRTVYEGRIWDVVSDTFSLSGSGEDVLVRDYIAHPGAVAILAMDRDGRVLLLKQYRQPAQMSFWEIPAGLLDVDGEDFTAAAVRELAEEADLVAARWDVLVDFFNSPGSSSEAIRIYLARELTDVAEAERHVRTEEEAEIEHRWVDLEEAADAVLDGRLHSPSAVAGILAAVHAARTGFRGLRPADAPWPEHPSQRHTWGGPGRNGA
ncbi:NUDIX domain-containing protein [Arthrobacter mobilis]|uniref:NUDIX hydrolase n=1 Tax=Arthrobacter mobilis TaxID=2724944 RepID=A0A7X6K806_9MICC|nr:NUDIX hydrolase [Arthrobacter mobilis]NKX56819.1 NUDIX hydrolase [Arthrobacter mobilis]